MMSRVTEEKVQPYVEVDENQPEGAAAVVVVGLGGNRLRLVVGSLALGRLAARANQLSISSSDHRINRAAAHRLLLGG
jgi:hypothetical protein